jgi:rare lipoprotein A
MQRAGLALTRVSAIAALCFVTPVIAIAGEPSRHDWIDLESEKPASSIELSVPVLAAVDTAEAVTAALETIATAGSIISSAKIEAAQSVTTIETDELVTAAIHTVPVEIEPIADLIPYNVGRVVLSARDAIIGIASFYDDPQQTASGEQYDPNAFTAAVQLEIRHKFAGVRYGRLYVPAYGLGEYGGKKIIVRFNDVGPLRPGRKFDLSRAAMAYFDKSLDKGLLPNFRIIPLPLGRSYPLGPVDDEQLAHLGIDDDAATAVCDIVPEPEELYTASIPLPKPPVVALNDQPKRAAPPPVIAKPVIAKPATTKVAAKAAPGKKTKTAAARTKPAPIKTAAAAPAPKAADTPQPSATPWIKRVWSWVTGS